MKTYDRAFGSGSIVIGSNDLELYSITKGNNNSFDYIASTENDIKSIIPSGERFFYIVEELSSNEFDATSNRYEFGVGYWYRTYYGKYKRKYNDFLRRLTVLEFSTDGTIRPPKSDTEFLNFAENDNIFIRTVVPQDLITYISTQPNSVLVSDSEGKPLTIELTSGTVLGFKDGELSAIGSTEIQEDIITPTNIVDAITSETGPITLITSTLSLGDPNSIMKASVVQASPVYTNTNKPQSPQRGMIIYNSDTNQFEGYNGTSWQSFQYLNEEDIGDIV